MATSQGSLRDWFSFSFLNLEFTLKAVISRMNTTGAFYLQNDFHYEYTQCDSSGGRWLVSVPAPDTCVGGQPEPPVRGRKCGMQTIYYYIGPFK